MSQDTGPILADNGRTILPVPSLPCDRMFATPRYRFKIVELDIYFSSVQKDPLLAYEDYFYTTPAIRIDNQVIVRCPKKSILHVYFVMTKYLLYQNSRLKLLHFSVRYNSFDDKCSILSSICDFHIQLV